MRAERAVHLARAAAEGCDSILMVGHSPYADHAWVSAVLAIHLPLFPKLKIQLITMFALELIQSVLAGELDLALVTAPPLDAHITAIPFARSPLYAVLPDTHPFLRNERLTVRDLAKDNWTLFANRVHPLVHSRILDAAKEAGIVPRHSHEIITAQQAVELVSTRHSRRLVCVSEIASSGFGERR